ncbi:ABC transporter permease [Candidatus Pacearchaeota archaeon CG_4_9_14_3_um_filter_31_7]|nr:MAG: ABC transporter permease [Candidatus Pacearchaeota archaeon CG_4_10_14_0_2_um_filter_31_10]PJA70513.1 MAG: ABC transporter permease [Candidatus Pacearchaeota archaeon CG_4_9_14_3_um_filter_31_7]
MQEQSKRKGRKMLKDYLKFSFNNLIHRKLRSWLTIIGIFIGIAAVVALISIGQGLQTAISDQFEKLGTDKITIQPGAQAYGMPGTTIGNAKLTDKDIEAIAKIGGVNSVVGYVMKINAVEFKEEVKYEFVVGMPLDSELNKMLADAQGYKIAEGRMLKEGDRYNALVGYDIANGKAFKKSANVGSRIMINNQEFKIIGTLEKIGNQYADGTVVLPLDTVIEILNAKDDYSVLMVQVKDVKDVDKISEEIKKVLRKEHGVKEGNEDFRVETTQQLLDQFNTIFGIVTAVFVGIAAISLLVGGIGIMNTMYTAVLERTKEIGIMKAVGAKNKDVFTLFFIESGLLGLVGGTLGILLGMGIAKIVEVIAGQAIGAGYLRAVFPMWLILGALAFGFVVGAAAGTLPAVQASKMKPVDALRYE